MWFGFKFSQGWGSKGFLSSRWRYWKVVESRRWDLEKTGSQGQRRLKRLEAGRGIADQRPDLSFYFTRMGQS